MVTTDGSLAELNRLLSETPQAAATRAAGAFDAQVGDATRRLILYGAGNLGRLVRGKLRLLPYEPVCFADGNSALWGSEIDGLPVLSPEEAGRLHGANAITLMTIWGGGTERLAERIKSLKAKGLERIVHVAFLFWKHPDVFLPYYAMDLPQHVLTHADLIRKAYALWSDDASRAEFVAQLRWRLHFDFDGLPAPVTHDVYFAPDLFALRPDERFVDCGAFDGDTLRVLLRQTGGKVDRIMAFEPDAVSHERLLQWLASQPASIRDRVTVQRKATGSQPGEVAFSSSGTPASAAGAGTDRVKVVRLDDELREMAPTFLKMDIEGAELDTLVGARETIRASRPIMTLSTYHKQDDLWTIPLEMAANAPDYAFFLRPHLLEVWELVTYAVPRERMRA